MAGVSYRSYRLAEIQRERGMPGAFTAGAGRFTTPIRWRPLDYVEIMAVIDGAGRKSEITEPGHRESVRLAPGHVFLVRSGTQHLIEGAGPNGISVIIVSFPLSDWQTLAGFIGIDPVWTTSAHLPIVTVDPEHLDALRAFDAALERSHIGPSRLELLQFLITVVPLLLPVYEPPRPTKEVPDWLAASIEAMQKEENLRGGVHRLQELAHVSAQYLSTIIRRHYGTTASALVADLRLRHAAMLLVTTAESIAGIAERCGYRSPEYFATSFKRAHHVTPRRYRSRFTEM